MIKTMLLAAVAASALPPVAHAQTAPGMDMPAPPATPSPTPAPAPQTMPGMDHGAMHHDMATMAQTQDQPPTAPEANAVGGSGTSRVPASGGAMQGLHAMAGDWMLMLHGYALTGYTDQGGPRGDDGLVLGTMAMIEAQRPLGDVSLQLRGMFSADPVLGPRGYPNLFATGETAHGRPLVDRQHPHDLFMELSARVDVPIGGGLTGYVYGGPVAEPALGPTAFMHRASDRYLALSPISHHWFDSTHVTFGVVTAGVATRGLQLEASAFNGREPDEERWGFDPIRLDSWSVRATWSPTPHWTAQVSHGRLQSPEAHEPGQDEARTTASVQYAGGGVSAMVAYAAKHRIGGDTLPAWLAEANWDVTRHHTLFGRIENVANDELFPDHDSPLHDRRFRVTRFEGGYAYRLRLTELTELALGGSLAAYAKPQALDAAYGKAPLSYTLFARLSLGS